MPFDVLPHHDIRIPNVQFYHPSPALAQIAMEGARLRYAAIQHGIDSILSATDPTNIAQRKMALLQADYQSHLLPMQLAYQQEFGIPSEIAKAEFERDYGIPLQIAQAQYTGALLPIQLQYLKKWGFPMPTNPQGAEAARRLQSTEDEAARRRAAADAAREASGGGGGSAQSATENLWEQKVAPSPGSEFINLNPTGLSGIPSPQWGQTPDAGEAAPQSADAPGGSLYNSDGSLKNPADQGEGT